MKGLYADFHDFGDTVVYTPNAGAITSVSGTTINFDNTGSWQYRHYIRRPDQQVFSVLTGVRQEFAKDVIVYEFAGSRGHNIGLLSGIGIDANYSYVTSRITFPFGFNAPTVGAPGRTDHPRLERDAPNNYNFNLTYDKGGFSSRFAISHNDANIYAYQWGPGTGPANDPVLGLKGPTGDQSLYAHTQFDIQGSYRTYKGIQLVVSGLNLSNEVFGFYDGSGIYPVQREY